MRPFGVDIITLLGHDNSTGSHLSITHILDISDHIVYTNL